MEIAPSARKGFFVSWQSGSQQVASDVGGCAGNRTHALAFAGSNDARWGWRIPLLIGCVLLPFLYYMRQSLEETPVFRARRVKPKTQEILMSIRVNWRIILLGMMMATMTTVSFYLATTYTPTYGTSVLHLDATSALVVTLCVGGLNLPGSTDFGRFVGSYWPASFL
jgi:MFS family permease